MNMKRRMSLFIIIVLLFMHQCYGQQNPKLGEDSIKEVIGAMTIREKVKMLVGACFDTADLPEGFDFPACDPEDADLPNKVPGTAGRMHSVERLGIPMLTLSDGPAGINARDGGQDNPVIATAFPNASLLASTWDTAVVQKVGKAMGNEGKEYGIDIILAPGMNIKRNPLNGRNFEYYSEDPVLSGTIASAMVNGIQSEDIGASIKHFVANNTETNRSQLDTIMSQRTLREIYLRGFEIAVKASQPWTVMSSYNKVNGTYTSQSKELLTDILKNEWGFDGTVMTDWYGGEIAEDQINAGNTLLMPGSLAQTDALISAVENDAISMETIDESVEKVLNLVMRSPTFKNYSYSNNPDLEAHAAISREAAADGMVLLKNSDNTLPLESDQTVAMFGNASYDIIAGGTGSGDVNRAYTISLYDGLINAGVPILEDLAASYNDYIDEEKANQPEPSIDTILNPTPPIEEFEVSDSVYITSSSNADVVIFTIGRITGEGSDHEVDDDFNLKASERHAIETLSQTLHDQGKKFIVVINAGSVIETASWREYADAILLAWLPGMEGGDAMADVLTGEVNPSGKLPVSFPYQYSDVSSSDNFPGVEIPASDEDTTRSEIVYEEGIYVGYRYHTTFNVKTAYPFGYGMSYTSFSYDNMVVSPVSSTGEVTVKVTVTNTGEKAGREIAELYISAPMPSIDKPTLELKGFAKTNLLMPGESETMTFSLTSRDLASFYEDQSAWIADAGEYEVKIGASSEDIRLTKSFFLETEIMVEKVNDVLKPQVEINELKKEKHAFNIQHHSEQ